MELLVGLSSHFAFSFSLSEDWSLMHTANCWNWLFSISLILIRDTVSLKLKIENITWKSLLCDIFGRLIDNSSFFTPYWIWFSQLVRYSVKAVSTGFSIPIFHDTFTFGDAVLTLVLFYPKRNFQLTERGENLFSRSQERRSKIRWLVVHFRGRFSLKFSCLLFVRYIFFV